jgi:hypothetical protein
MGAPGRFAVLAGWVALTTACNGMVGAGNAPGLKLEGERADGGADATGDATTGGSPDVGSAGDSGVPYNPGFTFTPGTGDACTSPPGDFVVSTCDPSDETAQGCSSQTTNGCSYDPKCGDTSTCEPFTDNPVPGTGIDNFRMRFLNVTSPPALANVEQLVFAGAVALPSSPDGGATCGEPTGGVGLLNWLVSVNRSAGTVETGGSPPSTNPFDVGYCYIDGTVEGAHVAPVTLGATFTGNAFTTEVSSSLLRIPIFTAPSGVVLLPLTGASLHDVHVSSDGNCIGALNISANSPASDCAAPIGFGAGSCSRWHAAGAVGGYITLADADQVDISLLNESLCVLLVGPEHAYGTDYRTCTAEAIASAGDYCSTTRSAGGCNDSFWFSAEFAASAVKIASGPGVDSYMGSDLCNGGSF